jgi:hypothetical protein
MMRRLFSSAAMMLALDGKPDPKLANPAGIPQQDQ